MPTFGPGTQVFVALGVTDMRKSFDTLAEVVRSTLSEDPLSGHVFGFCNRGRNRINLLVFDRGGGDGQRRARALRSGRAAP